MDQVFRLQQNNYETLMTKKEDEDKPSFEQKQSFMEYHEFTLGSVEAAAKQQFDRFWNGGENYASKLEQVANSYDLDTIHDKFFGDSEKADKNEIKEALGRLSSQDSSRRKKTRKNHMKKAASFYRAASKSYARMRDAEGNAAMESVNLAAESIEAIINAEVELVKTTGLKDEMENVELANLQVKKNRMLINLYEECLRTKNLVKAEKEIINEKLSALRKEQEKKQNQVDIANNVIAEAQIDQFQDLNAKDVYKLSENKYNTGKNRSLIYNDNHVLGGSDTGYITSKNAMLINEYLRDPIAFKKKQIKYYRDMDHLDSNQAEEKFKKWEIQSKKTIAALNAATKSCKMPYDTKVYRMTGAGFLAYGLGIANYEKLSSSEKVAQINQRAGTLVQDKNFVSTGYRVDKEFLDDENVMLTMLTSKGKQCFVTKNFAETEVIFPPGTKYTIVAAYDHTKERKTVPLSDGSIKENAKDVATDKTGSFGGIEIVVKMVDDVQ